MKRRREKNQGQSRRPTTTFQKISNPTVKTDELAIVQVSSQQKNSQINSEEKTLAIITPDEIHWISPVDWEEFGDVIHLGAKAGFFAGGAAGGTAGGVIAGPPGAAIGGAIGGVSGGIVALIVTGSGYIIKEKIRQYREKKKCEKEGREWRIEGAWDALQEKAIRKAQKAIEEAKIPAEKRSRIIIEAHTSRKNRLTQAENEIEKLKGEIEEKKVSHRANVNKLKQQENEIEQLKEQVRADEDIITRALSSLEPTPQKIEIMDDDEVEILIETSRKEIINPVQKEKTEEIEILHQRHVIEDLNRKLSELVEEQSMSRQKAEQIDALLRQGEIEWLIKEDILSKQEEIQSQEIFSSYENRYKDWKTDAKNYCEKLTTFQDANREFAERLSTLELTQILPIVKAHEEKVSELTQEKRALDQRFKELKRQLESFVEQRTREMEEERRIKEEKRQSERMLTQQSAYQREKEAQEEKRKQDEQRHTEEMSKKEQAHQSEFRNLKQGIIEQVRLELIENDKKWRGELIRNNKNWKKKWQKEVKILKDGMASLKSKNEDLEKEVTNLKLEKEELREKAKISDEQITRVNSEVQNLKEKNSSLEENKKQLSLENKKLKKVIKKLEKKDLRSNNYPKGKSGFFKKTSEKKELSENDFDFLSDSENEELSEKEESSLLSSEKKEILGESSNLGMKG